MCLNLIIITKTSFYRFVDESYLYLIKIVLKKYTLTNRAGNVNFDFKFKFKQLRIVEGILVISDHDYIYVKLEKQTTVHKLVALLHEKLESPKMA